MRGGLIRDDIGDNAAPQQFREYVGGVAHEADGEWPLLCNCVPDKFEGFVEVGYHRIQVSRVQSLLKP